MTDPRLVFKLVISTLVLTLILSVEGAPADLQNEVAKNCTDSDGPKVEENGYSEIIDQSQNGTDNYRLSIKDVVIIFSPLNSFLSGAGALLESQLTDYLESQTANKPGNEEKPPLVVDLMENKPLVQNSSEVMAPEKETEKPAILNPAARMGDLNLDLNYPALLGPFLRRKQNV